MRELNNKQIIKALECCGSKGSPKCADCPMEEKRGCAIELYRVACTCLKELIEKNKQLTSALDKSEMAVKTSRECATYIKCYLEGNMYASEEIARECVGMQIENAERILKSTSEVTV